MDSRISFSSAVYRVDRREIAFLRFVLEACSGLAVLTTLEPASGLVRLSVAAGREAEAQDLMEALAREEGIRIERQEDVPTSEPFTA